MVVIALLIQAPSVGLSKGFRPFGKLRVTFFLCGNTNPLFHNSTQLFYYTIWLTLIPSLFHPLALCYNRNAFGRGPGALDAPGGAGTKGGGLRSDGIPGERPVAVAVSTPFGGRLRSNQRPGRLVSRRGYGCHWLAQAVHKHDVHKGPVGRHR